MWTPHLHVCKAASKNNKKSLRINYRIDRERFPISVGIDKRNCVAEAVDSRHAPAARPRDQEEIRRRRKIDGHNNAVGGRRRRKKEKKGKSYIKRWISFFPFIVPLFDFDFFSFSFILSRIMFACARTQIQTQHNRRMKRVEDGYRISKEKKKDHHGGGFEEEGTKISPQAESWPAFVLRGNGGMIATRW